MGRSSRSRWADLAEYSPSITEWLALAALASSKRAAGGTVAIAPSAGQVSIRAIRLTGFVGFTKGRLRVAISNGEQKWEATIHPHTETHTAASLMKDAGVTAGSKLTACGDDEPTELHAGPRLEDIGKGSRIRTPSFAGSP